MFARFRCRASSLKHEIKAAQIVEIFNQCFADRYQTELVGNAEEPFYEVTESGGSTIYFCHDYPASALHEVAHWCVAGAKRRAKNDYGYWYSGVRDADRQKSFEAVEARPQALEWVFSRALGIDFKVSADNLNLPDYDLDPFRRTVRLALEAQFKRGLPDRASIFAAALAQLGQNSGYDRLHFYPQMPD